MITVWSRVRWRRFWSRFIVLIGMIGVITGVQQLFNTAETLNAVFRYSVVFFGIFTVLPLLRPYRNPATAVGTMIPLPKCDEFSPNIPRIAVCGVKLSGKSTLIRKFQFANDKAPATQNPYGSTFHEQRLGWIIVLDADGGDLNQQFEILERATLAILVFDHNESDCDFCVNDQRLSEQEAFCNLIRDHIRRNSTIRGVLVLKNKRDLWVKAAKISRDKFRDTVKSFVARLKADNRSRPLAFKSASMQYSNFIIGDFEQMLIELKKLDTW